MSSLSDFKTGFSTSADGTRIGYRSIGAGPGLILVHGALQSSLNFTTLARALSAHFTVYIPDRRGRGLSGAYRDNDNLATEAADMQTLLLHTNTHFIFGLSSGAIITLQTAFLEPVLKKIALYEPPIPLSESAFGKLDIDYGNAIREGNLGKAFVAILKGTGDTSFLSALPAFITAPVINIMMKAQMKNKNENELPLQELVPAFYHDRIVVKDSAALIDTAKNCKAETLLLGGSKSRKFFKPVLDLLSVSIPHAKRFEFEKQGHLAADNSGSPLKVANELLRFFKEN